MLHIIEFVYAHTYMFLRIILPGFLLPRPSLFEVGKAEQWQLALVPWARGTLMDIAWDWTPMRPHVAHTWQPRSRWFMKIVNLATTPRICVTYLIIRQANKICSTRVISLVSYRSRSTYLAGDPCNGGHSCSPESRTPKYHILSFMNSNEVSRTGDSLQRLGSNGRFYHLDAAKMDNTRWAPSHLSIGLICS